MALTPLTQQDFLALADRLLPASYLRPLKAGVGPGYELLQAMAKVCARLSDAVANFDAQAFIAEASAGSFATALVRFARPTAAAGAVTVRRGTLVTTSATGRDFVLLEDAVLTSGGGTDLLSDPVTVQAVAQSYEFRNARGPQVTAAGETIPGDIDTIKNLITAPEYADPTITVQQSADAAGGASDDLDQLGADVGLPRRTGEGDLQYRARIQQLPDTVSPAAVKRALTAFFQGFPAPWNEVYFLETFQLDLQTAYDVPSPAGLDPASPLYPWPINTCFAYDDTRGQGDPNVPNASGYFGRWLDLTDYRGAFVVVVPLLPAIADCGMAYDDPGAASGAVAPGDYETALGRRATPAYDAVGMVGPGLQGGFDGFDLPRAAVYAGLYMNLSQIAAGGVAVEIAILGVS